MSFGRVFNEFGYWRCYKANLATRCFCVSSLKPLAHFYLQKYNSLQGSAGGLLLWVRKQTTFLRHREPLGPGVAPLTPVGLGPCVYTVRVSQSPLQWVL